MNRIEETFRVKKGILNIYFTAGFPALGDTIRIAKALEDSGADMLEIGIPFSDPVADGSTIQESSKKALENGMNLSLLFEQLSELRNEVKVPVLLMGYMNPILQFGIEQFCDECLKVGIDGAIIPDLPMQEYLDLYQSHFKSRGIHNIFLIGPHTSEERIRWIDEKSSGFIYMVSSSSITGAKSTVQEGQVEYYQRIQKLKLKNPRLIGFGISNYETFQTAYTYSEGAIVGSAFINQLTKDHSKEAIKKFIHSIRGK